MNANSRFYVRSLKRITTTMVLVFAVTLPMWSQSAKDPLDGLTSSELWTTYEVLRASGKVDAYTRYPMVQLKEPPKEEVLAWKPGQPMRREAFVVVWKGKQTFEAVVDVKGKKLVSWTEMKGVQPNIVREEENEITAGVMADAGLQAALKRRGITDLNSVFCFVNTPGYFGTPEEQGRRLFRVEHRPPCGPHSEQRWLPGS